MNHPSWSVVSTADEPLPLLAAFALHYLALGASEVHLYLDSPRPEDLDLLRSIDGVHVTACDAAYWRGNRRRSIENRQRHNAVDAYRRSAADWMAHVDCDEFLATDDARGVGAVLADLPDDIDALVLPMRERVYLAQEPVDTLFAGAGLSPFDLRRDIAAPTRALRRRHRYSPRGLLGHAVGKTFLRTRRPLLPGIHRPRPAADHCEREQGRAAVRLHPPTALHLVHFDGITPFHWTIKLWRMARQMPDKKLALHSPGRQRLIRKARETLPDIAPLATLERKLRALDRESVEILTAAGAFHALPRDPANLVIGRGLLPRAAFHPEAFDRALVALHPDAAPLHDAWRALASGVPHG